MHTRRRSRCHPWTRPYWSVSSSHLHAYIQTDRQIDRQTDMCVLYIMNIRDVYIHSLYACKRVCVCVCVLFEYMIISTISMSMNISISISISIFNTHTYTYTCTCTCTCTCTHAHAHAHAHTHTHTNAYA
jgi:hypothetical protein